MHACINLSKDKVKEDNVAGLTLQIPKTVLRADFLVNLPKLKTFTSIVMTDAMKNIFGLLANDKKSTLHSQCSTNPIYWRKRTKRKDKV